MYSAFCFLKDDVGEIVKDKNDKPLILTDGTSFTSEDLALRCPHNCCNGYVNNEDKKKTLSSLELPGVVSVAASPASGSIGVSLAHLNQVLKPATRQEPFAVQEIVEVKEKLDCFIT